MVIPILWFNLLSKLSKSFVSIGKPSEFEQF